MTTTEQHLASAEGVGATSRPPTSPIDGRIEEDCMFLMEACEQYPNLNVRAIAHGVAMDFDDGTDWQRSCRNMGMTKLDRTLAKPLVATLKERFHSSVDALTNAGKSARFYARLVDFAFGQEFYEQQRVDRERMVFQSLEDGSYRRDLSAMEGTKEMGRVTMPGGRYYVGDPGYAFSFDHHTANGHLWSDWLNNAGHTGAKQILDAEIVGYRVVGIPTAFGDGSYSDLTTGAGYGVDAGLIGLVPMEFIERFNVEVDVSGCGGHISNFPTPFDCVRWDNGVIEIGPLIIPT